MFCSNFSSSKLKTDFPVAKSLFYFGISSGLPALPPALCKCPLLLELAMSLLLEFIWMSLLWLPYRLNPSPHSLFSPALVRVISSVNQRAIYYENMRLPPREVGSVFEPFSNYDSCLIISVSSSSSRETLLDWDITDALTALY